MGIVVWIIATTAHADCVPQPERLTELERAVLAGRNEEARASVDRLVEAFGCGPMAEPGILARLWLAQAVLFDRSGETLAANEALLAAGERSPSTWVDGYGLAMRVRQLRLMASDILRDRPRGTVEVEPEGYFTGIDGLRHDRFPAAIPAGLHLVQVGPSAREMRHAELVDVLPETDLVVVTGLEPPRRSLTIQARRRRRLLTGAGFAAGAIASAALTTAAESPGLDGTLVGASVGLLTTSVVYFVHGATTGRKTRVGRLTGPEGWR